jgi:hypothetical protein
VRPPGDVRLALAKAWQQGPAPVREAAQRACVGMAAARYTASRMVDSGELVVLQGGKPAVLAPAPARVDGRGAAAARAEANQPAVHQALDLLGSVMWGAMR